MTSKSLPAISLATAVLLSLATTVFGETAETTPAERLLATLKERYPATPFTRVQNTPVPGLYEVVFGNNIAYAADDGRHFLFGHLLDLQTQRDLTAANAPPIAPAPGVRSCSMTDHRRQRPVRIRSSAIARWRRSWRYAAPRP